MEHLVKDNPAVQFLNVEISFEVPIKRELYDLGSLTLEKDGRNFTLAICNSFTNEDNTVIIAELEVDEELFPSSKEYRYDLTINDLLENPNATLYIGTEYEEVPMYISLFVRVNGMVKAIDVTIS